MRHADAGSRERWVGPDHVRPLSDKGWQEARGLVPLLADRPIARVLSSPFVRCVQTVEPLADALGLEIEETASLAEGAGPGEVVALVRHLVPVDAVLCTHGDVVPTLLDELAVRDGLRLPSGYPCAKGSTWVLEPDGDGRFRTGSYLPPP